MNRHDLRAENAELRSKLREKERELKAANRLHNQQAKLVQHLQADGKVVLSNAVPSDELYVPLNDADRMKSRFIKELNAQVDLSNALMHLTETLFSVIHMVLVYPENPTKKNGIQLTTLAEQVKGFDEILSQQLIVIRRVLKGFDIPDLIDMSGLASLVLKFIDAIQECERDRGSKLKQITKEHGNQVIQKTVEYRESITRHRGKEARTKRLIELIDQHKSEGKAKWDIITHNVYSALKRNEPRLSDLDKNILDEFEERMVGDIMTRDLYDYLQKTYNQDKSRKAQQAKKLQSRIEVSHPKKR